MVSPHLNILGDRGFEIGTKGQSGEFKWQEHEERFIGLQHSSEHCVPIAGRPRGKDKMTVINMVLIF